MDKTNIGIAGEFYVLAQLAHRGLVASLTLANTKGIDILVSNPKLDHLFRVEVKTTDRQPALASLFGPEPFFRWPMSEKHETLEDAKLFYCFVQLQGIDFLPRFFIVPSPYVAEYVREQHRFWERTRTREVSKTNRMRIFRIPVSDPMGFENNWEVFQTGVAEERHLHVKEGWYLSHNDSLDN